jgi:3-oxoacyl-(acyl-carrier-protein) synthase
MDKLFIKSAAAVQASDLQSARLGSRFGRLDLTSQLALLAVESLGLDFDQLPRDRIGICLAVAAGSLSTDVEYWEGRDAPGGPSPTLFAYTLPSAAIGEIAIRHRLTGPNFCLVGSDAGLLDEAAHLILSGETAGCICISCNVVNTGVAALIGASPAASAYALYMTPTGPGLRALREIDRDIASLFDIVSRLKSAS